MKKYLQLEFKSGLFFEYSKTQKEGFEPTEKGDAYRQYYNYGVEGILRGVSIYDGKFGPNISFKIDTGTDTIYAPISISDPKGNVSTYAESAIKLLGGLSVGDPINLRGYNFIPEGDKYKKIGISIKVAGEKVKPTLKNSYYSKDGELVEGDIPALQYKQDPLGKKKPSAASLEQKNDFLLAKLKEQTDRLSSIVSTPPVSEPEKAVEQEVYEEENDDLPF